MTTTNKQAIKPMAANTAYAIGRLFPRANITYNYHDDNIGGYDVKVNSIEVRVTNHDRSKVFATHWINRETTAVELVALLSNVKEAGEPPIEWLTPVNSGEPVATTAIDLNWSHDDTVFTGGKK